MASATSSTWSLRIALDITPDFLEQLIAVKTLLGMTSLTLVQLLCLWTEIPTRGCRSRMRRAREHHDQPLLGQGPRGLARKHCLSWEFSFLKNREDRPE